MRKYLYIIFALVVCLFERKTCNAIGIENDSSAAVIDRQYKHAYDLLEAMLQLNSNDFKTAVFYVENAFLDNKLSFKNYDREIKQLAKLSEAYINTNNIVYPYSDSLKVMKYAAVFKMMTDSIPVVFNGRLYHHIPFRYDFEDFDGSKDWGNTFVSTLLQSHKGNCHSMPYLYKMIVQELGDNAYLALAPNHIYIKLFCQKDGWYNTELTSGQFPIDSWLMASGYIHLSAIQNGIYMDTLDNRKAIAMCLVDLALGYERKLGIRDGTFILNCCNLALQYFADGIPMQLLKFETYQSLFTERLNKNNYKTPLELISRDTEANRLFDNMQSLAKKMHDLGYRRMPQKMYMDWLASLATEKEKYTNKNINFTNIKQR
jgi:hypothetical protein